MLLSSTRWLAASWAAPHVLVVFMVAASTGGCGFTPSNPGMVDGGDSSAFEGITTCPPGNNNPLLACFLFDGSATDGSTNGFDGVEFGIDYVAGQAGLSARFEGDSRIVLPDGPLLDASELTIEAWVRYDIEAGGPTERVAIIDNDAQYSLFIGAEFQLQCNLGGRVEGGRIPSSEWVHLACTQANGMGTAYINGSVSASASNLPALVLGENRGVEIGNDVAPGQPGRGQFQGEIDNLLVWERSRSPAELCTTSGACNSN